MMSSITPIPTSISLCFLIKSRGVEVLFMFFSVGGSPFDHEKMT